MLLEEEGFEFFLQLAGDAPPEEARRRAGSLAALFEPVRVTFEDRIARTLGLRAAPGARPRIAVLTRPEDFERYVRVTGAEGHYGARAFHDGALRAAVILDDSDGTRDRQGEARSARHALVHAMQALYAPPESELTSWAFEAMAVALASPEGMDWDRERSLKLEIRTLLREGAEESRRRSHLLDLRELVGLRHPAALAGALEEALGFELSEPERTSAYWSFHRQGRLLHEFLLHELDGRYALGHERFLAGVFAGRESLEEFLACFEGIAPEEIDRDFQNWMRDIHRATWPEEEVDHRDTSDGPSLLLPSGDAVEVGPPGVDLARIPADAHLGRALVCMREGKAVEALSHLDTARRVAEAQHRRARIARARRRVEAWLAARRSHFETLAATGAPVYLPIGGRKRRTRVREATASELVVVMGSEVRTVALEGIDPRELAKRMKATLPDELAWIPSYVSLLHGEPGWKGSGGSGPQLDALQADAPGCAELLLAGEAATSLVRAAAMEAPRNVSEAEANLAAISALLHDHGERPMVRENAPALERVARAQAEALFELSDPWELLHGRVQGAGNDRVRLTWEFETEEELLDFERVDHLPDQRERLGTDKAGEGFRIAAGNLEGRGEDSLLLPIELRAPIRVRYELSIGSQGEAIESDDYLAVGICDDRSGGFAWMLGFFFLELHGGGELRKAYLSSSYFSGTSYAMELAHDGAELRASWEGQEVGPLPADRDRGGLFLWLHANAVARVARLEVEGRLPDDPFERFRERWIARRLEFPGSAR